ncbi:MAG TPA: asparaginase [Candidatus Limnocylindrales bacterium]|nr:asparaginase [Candidatus Limnocylindrales bacterium]
MSVVAVFTGGTIASQPDAAAGGAVPRLTGAQIIERTPALAGIAQVEPHDWGFVPAAHMGFDVLIAISRLLDEQLARDDVTGAVVVQGTDTIEETAFAYDLLVDSDKPVVVTGAMRNSAEPDYDGPRNLADAVRCAAADELRRMGGLVVLAGRILGADRAIKAHSSALEAFQPRNGGFLGTVGESGVVVEEPRHPVRLPSIPERAAEPVHLVTAVTGLDGSLVRLAADAGLAGLVVAGNGTGNTHPDLLAAAEELIGRGVPVALTTRCPTGVSMPAYAFPGGGAQWARAGAMLSALDGPKCRVALALGLGVGLAGEELRRVLRA